VGRHLSYSVRRSTGRIPSGMMPSVYVTNIFIELSNCSTMVTREEYRIELGSPDRFVE
jgi:hypothetical protein